MEDCFTFFIFVFLSFALFRVKHNGINDFCKVSVSLALNDVFSESHGSAAVFPSGELHTSVRSMVFWDESVKTEVSVGISTGAGIL